MTQIQRKINWIKMHALQEAQQPVSNAFITTWNMTSGAFTLLTQTGTYNATIDWGDGTSSIHTTGSPTHTYASAGQYQIKITGQYNGLRINNDATQKDKLIAVNAWGNVGISNLERAFYGCSNLVNIALLVNSITNIGDHSFRSCVGLTSIIIPDSATSIGYQAFQGCKSLTSITIPNSVTSILGTSYFYGCTALANVTLGTNFNTTINLSNCTTISAETQIAMFNALKNNVGLTAKTLTLGSTNLARCTTAEKNIAINKNWILN